SLKLANQLNLSIDRNSTIDILQVDGKVNSIGRCIPLLTIGSQCQLTTFHVLSNFRYPLLLGLDVGQRFGLTINLSTRKVTANYRQVKPLVSLHLEPKQNSSLEQLLVTHKKAFAQTDTDIGRIHIVKHKIITVPHPPIQLRPYR